MACSVNKSFINTVANLQERGFEYDFSFTNNDVWCAQSQISLSRHEFSIIEMYFFPGEDTATEERMLYVIYAPDYDIKGVLVIKGVNNNILFLDMMKGKTRPQITEIGLSIEWKYLMTESFFY